jgi:hypothetical protein
MTIVWVEDNASRSATIARIGKKAQSVYKKSWKLFGATNDNDVHQDINSRLTVGQLFWDYPGNPSMRLQAESYSVEYLGDDAWQLEVTYTKEGAEDPEQPDPLRRTRSFDTGGGSQHITQAQPSAEFTQGEQRFWTGSPAAPNMNGAIGVDGDSVNGVDIVVPALTWTETYDVPHQFITSQYIKNLSRVTGTVNNAEFRTFPAGEILFLGASGSQEWDSDKGEGPWNLSFKFTQSPNAGPGKTLPALTIGDITNIEKDGHDYMWIRYEDAVDSETLIKKPKFVYVNRVYRRENFGQLGLGDNQPNSRPQGGMNTGGLDLGIGQT